VQFFTAFIRRGDYLSFFYVFAGFIQGGAVKIEESRSNSLIAIGLVHCLLSEGNLFCLEGAGHEDQRRRQDTANQSQQINRVFFVHTNSVFSLGLDRIIV
jgi:hypothetical protein